VQHITIEKIKTTKLKMSKIIPIAIVALLAAAIIP
jgi:hypothetical protein